MRIGVKTQKTQLLETLILGSDWYRPRQTHPLPEDDPDAQPSKGCIVCMAPVMR